MIDYSSDFEISSHPWNLCNVPVAALHQNLREALVDCLNRNPISAPTVPPNQIFYNTPLADLTYGLQWERESANAKEDPIEEVAKTVHKLENEITRLNKYSVAFH